MQFETLLRLKYVMYLHIVLSGILFMHNVEENLVNKRSKFYNQR